MMAQVTLIPLNQKSSSRGRWFGMEKNLIDTSPFKKPGSYVTRILFVEGCYTWLGIWETSGSHRGRSLYLCEMNGRSRLMTPDK